MQIENIDIAKNKFHAVVIPMFHETGLDTKMVVKTEENKGLAEISLFDVKELYDLAYSKPSNSDAFKEIMADAVKMDMAYRRQLAENTGYKGPFGSYEQQESAQTTPKTSSAA